MIERRGILGAVFEEGAFTDLIVHNVTRVTLHLAHLYRKNEIRIRRRAERRCLTGYDDTIAGFVGGELEPLVERNYAKALRLLWKAELQAPYLGIRDASKQEKHARLMADLSTDTDDYLELATSEQIRDEFRTTFSASEQEAIVWILSLITHGEAYALYISSTLLSFVKGTGSKLALSMQVMEEAKHYMVLRALVRTLADETKPLHTSARVFMEKVAQSRPYERLFGLNVIMESFALEFFGEFSRYPCFGQLFKKFLLDESRHCAFPKNYAALGLIPDEVKNGLSHKLRRTQIVLTAIPIVFDYRPYFEALGIETFGLVCKVLSKALHLAEASGLPLLLTREKYLAFTNLSINSYVRATAPDRYKGFRDYCLLHDDPPHQDSTLPRGGSPDYVPTRSNHSLYWRFYGDAIHSINRMQFQKGRYSV